MPDLTQLTGVGVAALSVYLMWNLLQNHLRHLTNAIQKLALSIEKLERRLRK